MVRSFGFNKAEANLFLRPRKVVRMGIPPVRLEILTTISGVEFAECYLRRIEAELDGIVVPLIHQEDLIRNKRAAGRFKDQADLEQLS